MKLGHRVVSIALLSVALCVAASLFVQSHVIHRQGIELTRQQMSDAVIEAENVRNTISSLNRDGAFDRAKLLAEYHASGDLRGSTLYRTIPVVAAWQAIEQVAHENDWKFRVPKTRARNPDNLPTEEEKPILELLEAGGTDEYFRIDRERNEIVFARPIKLSADCLACHGDPALSPTGDGKDILGFTMENWKEGEVHGAFLLRASMDTVDQVARAGLYQTLIWILPVAIAVAIATTLYTRRRIIRPLERSIELVGSASEQTAGASREISNAAQQLASGASEQAASLEETHASIEQIAAAATQNVRHAGEARALAMQTLSAADTGNDQMNAMTGAMDEIKDASHQIAKIVKTIDEIAFQTNILALNAAVEAARAGEAGAGFSIVADEVRALAQRSATAARETADNITDSIRKSENGVAMSAKVAAALRDIAAKAREMEHLVSAINTGSSEQNTALGQVNNAVGDMDKVTQVNAAAAEETSAAAEQLNAQSLELDAAVRDLGAIINGTPAGRSPA